jgi:hypothetical protein
MEGLSSLGSLALNNGTGGSGGLASNYQLTGGIDVVTVTPLAITVAGAANSKTYDGTTVATLSALGSGGVIAGDTVAFTDTGAVFANKNAANGKTVTIYGITDSGADAGNYSLDNTTAITTANVTPLAIIVSAEGTPKVYDGTTTDAVSLATNGILSGDTVSFSYTAATFSNKNVGNDKTISVTGITDAGTDAENYRFNASALTTADVTPATLIETAIPVSVEAGLVPTLGGSLSGFVPGDTRANATDGTLTWLTNAKVPTTPGLYAIDGSGLTAENYVLLQSPINATALTITAPTTATPSDGLFGTYLASADIATPYGVGSANDYGNNTGNARRDTNPTDGNRHLSDFTGRLALKVVDAGIKMPAEAGL